MLTFSETVSYRLKYCPSTAIDEPQSYLHHVDSDLLLLFTDNEEPVFYGIPSDISQNTNHNSPTATVTWTPPIASDNANKGVTVTSSHNPGESFVIGTTRVSYTATDPHGNSATSSFDVVVVGKMEATCIIVSDKHPKIYIQVY